MNIPTEKDNFTKRLLTICGVVTLIILLIISASYVIDVIVLLFAAVLLAILLNSLANQLRRFIKISEGLAVLVVSILLVAIFALAVSFLAPDVAEQVTHLRQELPKSAQKAAQYLSRFSWGKTIINQLPDTNEIIEKINNSEFISRVGGFFSSTLGAIANFAIVILLAIYLASEPKIYMQGAAKLFPFSYRKRVLEVLSEIGETLSWWLVGKFASMAVIGILTWIGLWIIGVPLALTLGLIAAFLAFIPNFGPILSAVPAILLAFIDSPTKALYAVALYIGVQLIESNLITPLIERETVELPPALTIVSQLILSVILGGLGLVLATPILAVLMVLIQMVYIQDILGDTNIEVNEKEKNHDENEDLSKKVEEKIE